MSVVTQDEAAAAAAVITNPPPSFPDNEVNQAHGDQAHGEGNLFEDDEEVGPSDTF